MTKELIVLLDNEEVGRVIQTKGKLTFFYADNWRNHSDAYPISLSMPLSSREYGHKHIDAFLWGLLPDNPRIIESWARRYQVGPGSAFNLLAHVGEDCAGAIQFVVPSRLEAVRNGTEADVEWLDEHGIAERLRRLVVDHAAWRTEVDTGQFSLAGAQPKTAFVLENGRWGVPAGRIPTSHIFKPPLADYDGHAENEHFCLELAERFGLLAPQSRVMRFEDQVAIVVKRYDREPTETGLQRVHQEDLCQAHGLYPPAKYENEGGPGATEILTLLERHSASPAEDREAFIDALILNWLVGGSDAHAKNYSILIGRGGEVRLAPLYDVASALPYDTINYDRIALAMKIGGKYRLSEIRAREWEKFAVEHRVDPEGLLHRIKGFAERMPDLVNDTQTQLADEGLGHKVIDRLSKRLIGRANRCREMLERRDEALPNRAI